MNRDSPPLAAEIDRLRAELSASEQARKEVEAALDEKWLDRHASCAERLEKAERELAEERAIVDRIWAIFGTPSYAELKGRSIYDLINTALKERDEYKRALLRCHNENLYGHLLCSSRSCHRGREEMTPTDKLRVCAEVLALPHQQLVDTVLVYESGFSREFGPHRFPDQALALLWWLHERGVFHSGCRYFAAFDDNDDFVWESNTVITTPAELVSAIIDAVVAVSEKEKRNG